MLAADMEPTRAIRRARAIIPERASASSTRGSLSNVESAPEPAGRVVRTRRVAARDRQVARPAPVRGVPWTTRLDGAHARGPRPPDARCACTTNGAPRIHDWPRIIQLDAEFCRTYFVNHNRVPGWKEREDALSERLGNKTPHLKTLQQHLPKIALLKERSSRSI